MADKLLIVLSNIDLNSADQLLTPLSQAATAAAMEYEVEIVFSGAASKLAGKKYSQTIVTHEAPARSVLQLIQQAKQAGVVFKVCTPALDARDQDLIDEIAETVGGTYVITEAMDDSVITFTY